MIVSMIMIMIVVEIEIVAREFFVIKCCYHETYSHPAIC